MARQGFYRVNGSTGARSSASGIGGAAWDLVNRVFVAIQQHLVDANAHGGVEPALDFERAQRQAADTAEAAARAALDAAALHKTGAETKTGGLTLTGDFHLWTKKTRFDVQAAAGADDNARLAASLNQAGASAPTAGGADVHFGDGDYALSPFTVPHQVNLLGAGPSRVRLNNLATDWRSFILHYGSRTTIAGFTVDAKRSAQVPTAAGPSALQVVKPNGNSGGSTILSGGLLLTGSVAAGATSLPVAVASCTDGTRVVPVMASDVITVADDDTGANYEILRVARSYLGGTSIPLDAPTLFPRTTMARVSIASTGVLLEDLVVYGLFIGTSMWHAMDFVERNVRVFDCIDLGLDFEGGCRGFSVTDCWSEGYQRFLYGVDANVSSYGHPDEGTFRDCSGRFLNGGSDPMGAGVAMDGFYIGVCEDISVVGGNIDLRQAGNAGIRRDAQGAQRFSVDGLGVVGPDTIRAGTFGYVSFNHDPARPYGAIVRAMKIRNVERGIDFVTDRVGRATNCLISAPNSPGVLGIRMTAMLGGGAVAQRLDSSQNDIDGCEAAISAGGFPVAGSVLNSSGDSTRNTTYPVITDAGWTVNQWP